MPTKRAEFLHQLRTKNWIDLGVYSRNGQRSKSKTCPLRIALPKRTHRANTYLNYSETDESLQEHFDIQKFLELVP